MGTQSECTEASPSQQYASPSPPSSLPVDAVGECETDEKRTDTAVRCSLGRFSIDAILSSAGKSQKRPHLSVEGKDDSEASNVADCGRKGDQTTVPKCKIAKLNATSTMIEKGDSANDEEEEVGGEDVQSTLEAEQGWVDWLTSFPPERAAHNGRAEVKCDERSLRPTEIELPAITSTGSPYDSATDDSSKALSFSAEDLSCDSVECNTPFGSETLSPFGLSAPLKYGAGTMTEQDLSALKQYKTEAELGLHGSFPMAGALSDFLNSSTNAPATPTGLPSLGLGMPAPSYSFFNRLATSSNSSHPPHSLPRPCLSLSSSANTVAGGGGVGAGGGVWDGSAPSNWTNSHMNINPLDFFSKLDGRFGYEPCSIKGFGGHLDIGQCSQRPMNLQQLPMTSSMASMTSAMASPYMDNAAWLGSAGLPGSLGEQLVPDNVTNREGGMAPVQVRLTNIDLWRRFHEHRTEMIVTRTGRCVSRHNWGR